LLELFSSKELDLEDGVEAELGFTLVMREEMKECILEGRAGREGDEVKDGSVGTG